MPPVAVDAVLKIDSGEQADILATSQSPGGDDLLRSRAKRGGDERVQIGEAEEALA
jgi:hypothetical protein